MNKQTIQTLVINDDDLNCKDMTKDIDTINLSSVAFVSSDLDRFQSIIYSGSRGIKILKHPILPSVVVKRGFKKISQ